MRTRARAGTAVLGAASLLVSALLPLTTAQAADGPPPPSSELRVLSRLHTDAVSTFLTDGTLELGSKADVPEGNGTRLDPTGVLFHVDDASRLEVPAGFEFIAPAGSTVWMAPETNPSGPDGYTQIWPGFSTESVPAGALQGDRTTFTLTGLDGPGDLELFTSGALGQTNRLWSTDEGLSSFTVGRTHMHANWAFTAPGTYTIGVRAEATTTGGAAVSAQNTYTFVVGPLAPAATTTTTLAASATSTQPGESVRLDATVAPAGATGWVEFLDGGTTLGHAEVSGGAASIDVTTLPLGTRSLTARFVPAVLNDHAASTSAPVSVTVTEEAGGAEFGIAGLRPSYAAGDEIHLRPQGVTPAAGQSLWWLIRTPGSVEYLVGQDTDFVRDATTAFDATEIALVLRGPVDGKQTILQQSAWSTISVSGQNVGSGEPVSLTGLQDSYYLGDPVTVTADHAPLGAGQSYQWAGRVLPYGDAFYPLWDDQAVTGDNPFTLDTAALDQQELVLQIVGEDGAVVGQSPAISPALTARELLLSGARSVYRDGETLELASELFPVRDGISYQWGTGERYGFEPVDGATGPTLSLPLTAADDGRVVTLRVSDSTTGFTVAEQSVTVRVTSAAPGEQLVLLAALADHYHQRNPVVLRATADPVAGDSDTWHWEWQLPGRTAWSAIPGATAATHTLTAEQALDGALARAVLRTAGGDVLATSESVTIHVDDHGAAPVQKAAITGLEPTYRAGDPVSLEAGVAPASVLSRWEWYLQRPGSDTPALLEDTLGSTLSFTASRELDGAAVFARLTFDDGRPYVESAPVVLAVQAAQPADPDPTDPGTPDPTDPGTPDPTDPGTPDPTDPGTPDPTDPGTPDPTDPGTPDPQPTDPGQPADPAPTEPTEPADPAGKPATAPAARTGQELEGVPAGGVTLSTASARQGEVVTVDLGSAHAGRWVAAWMFSTPALLGGDWIRADAAGTIAVRVPADAPAGAHRIAVFAADGSLVGWAAVTVAEASGATPTDSLAVTGSAATPLLAVMALMLAAGAGAVLLSRQGRARRRA